MSSQFKNKRDLLLHVHFLHYVQVLIMTQPITGQPGKTRGRLLRVLIVVLVCCIGFATASSNYNYNVYNYDMAPTFTPDGRLLQVEYASAAAELSSPIVALQVDNETLVLLTLKNTRTPQNRIIVLPTRGDGRHTKAQSPVCIAMSGVLPDSISLIQVGLKEASKKYKQLHTPITVLQIATSIANACQSHSFGGGIRPYGCTLLTCGYTSSGDLVLYQTDPSGALLEANLPSNGQKPLIRWMVGGNASLQRKIRKRLDSTLYKLKESTALLDVVALVGRTLMKETQKQAQGDNSDGSTGTITLEVVVMNRKLGCYKLAKSEIDSMIA